MSDNFDVRAKEWDEKPERHERSQAVARAIKASGITPKTALEFGCGTGLLTFALRPFAEQTVLADTSPGMIDVLTKKVEDHGAVDLSPRLISEGAPELEKSTFDVIYSLLTLHHIEDTAKTLTLFRDHLTPDGVLFICDLDEESGSFHGDNFSGHCGFSRESLTGQLKRAGFSSVTFQTCHAIHKEVNGCLTPFPLFLATARP